MRVIAYALGSLMLLSGCESITQGTTQTLIFSLEPQETHCKVARNGEELGSVSTELNTINISKSKRDIIVTCNAAGYNEKTLRLISSTQTGGVVGGAFLDLGITDMITGAMWKYDGTVNVVLDKKS